MSDRVKTTTPAEARELRDERTGARIWQLTSHESINHNLYFLTPSLTPDETQFVFCSYRGGSPQFWAGGFPTGELRQVTDEEGVNGFSGTLSPNGEELYYTAAGKVRAVRLATGEPRTLAEFPGASLGECSLSADGRKVVSALKRDGLNCLAVTEMAGGGKIILELERTIIHPQFHPRDNTLIEYAQDPAPRMWTIRTDGSDNTCLYEHGNNEFLLHEAFLGDGDELIVTRWPYALQRFHLARREMTEIAAFNAWHIAGSRDGSQVLCDTARPDAGLQLVDVATGARRTVCYPESSCGGSQWDRDRYALAEDFAAARAAGEEGALSWMEMKTDTVYGPQWSHPHPSFSPSERWVVYTSDRTGQPQVYAADLHSLGG